jgi:phosphoenolpyruvate phosphomutase
MSKILSKSRILKSMLLSNELEFLMEAHNGISAKIAEEAGFNGIWGSGLSISAQLGVRDNNEASWTQVLEVLEFMSDATTIPILLDGDTGYGNFNNMRRLVMKLEQRRVAGVCIEDKIFPKTNSFIEGEAQPLADVEEFCGKIKAGKDAQMSDDFCIVARVEALIAGWSLGEALKRAEAYRRAGADAILIHSKKSTAADIEAFMAEWAGRHPVVIVPTKYYSTPTDRFRELGVSVVIWANHLLRASVRAMQETAARIRSDQSLVNVESRVASVSDIFRLQGDDELRVLEDRYLPQRGKQVSAIILAASRGAEMGELTATKPKAMIQVAGQPVLSRLVDDLNALDVKTIAVVRGFGKQFVTGTNFTTIDNDEYEATNDLYSLFLAEKTLTGSTLITYGDTLFRRHLLSDALAIDADFVVIVDAVDRPGDRIRDMVRCSKPYANDFFNNDITLRSVESSRAADGHSGEWTGVLYVSDKGAGILRKLLHEMAGRPGFRNLNMIDMLNELAASHRVTVLYTKGGWIDIDDAHDLEQAGGFNA